MTLDELTPWLFARVSGGLRWGLDRTERLLAGVGNPHRHFRSILIGGTNGKGSVAALCDAVLRAENRYRIGLYTSPHLVSFTERIRIDGAPIDAESLAACAERLRPAVEESGASFFEATTAMAFLAMAEAGVDLAVVEVGLGGRLDATNVVSPLVTGVTNVAYDHSDYLGTSIEEIAREKAGIFRPGVPALIGETDAAARTVLMRSAEEVGAELHRLEDRVRIARVEVNSSGTEFDLASESWGEDRVRVGLIGAHQAVNAAFAAELLGLLPESYRPAWDSVERGFSSVRWPGRVQVERIHGTTWLFDVAHNPAGAESLAETIALLELPRPVVGLVGILRDKDWPAMLHALAPRLDALVLTVPESAPESRRWELAEVGAWCRSNLQIPVREIPALADAMDRATTLAPHGTLVVTGSVHTVGDTLGHCGIRI